jgi:hypothetical protein
VTGNERVAPLIDEQLKSGAAVDNPRLAERLLRDLRDGRPIAGRLSPMHFGIDRANFTREQVEGALAAQINAAPAPV